jgi:hypothetical protein
MQQIKRIAGINLVILLVYMALVNISFLGEKGEAALGVLIIAMVLIGIHAGLLFITSIVLFLKRSDYAKAFLLSSLVVLIIGFSACWGSASFY